eukprot:29809_1
MARMKLPECPFSTLPAGALIRPRVFRSGCRSTGPRRKLEHALRSMSKVSELTNRDLFVSCEHPLTLVYTCEDTRIGSKLRTLV